MNRIATTTQFTDSILPKNQSLSEVLKDGKAIKHTRGNGYAQRLEQDSSKLKPQHPMITDATLLYALAFSLINTKDHKTILCKKLQCKIGRIPEIINHQNLQNTTFRYIQNKLCITWS
jgi:hypothetical protein